MTTIGWDYGKNLPPELWHLIKGSSARGQSQSPIEIYDQTSVPGAPSLPSFKYHPVSLTDFVFTSSHLEVEVRSSEPGHLTYNNFDYSFRNFHLHTPSEHTFGGRYSAMEIHAVHKWNEGQPDERVVVIAVCVEVGDENPELAKLVSLLGNVRYQPVAELVDVSVKTIYPDSLYPKSSGYYFYEGSLTTPPCSENVVFFLFKEPITASCCQISQFEKFSPGGNNRPLQPLNGRKVYRSAT